MLLQRRELGQLFNEEKAVLTNEEVIPTLCRIQEERTQLESMLCQLATDENHHQAECLVTKTMNLDEVRKELNQWQPAIKAEYEPLRNHQAIQPISRERYPQMCRDPAVQVETVPSKLVATLKPPFRRKARIVACGNLAEQGDANISAGGADTIAVRALVSRACQEDWQFIAN